MRTYKESVKAKKLSALKLEIAAARLATQYREKICEKYKLPDDYIRVDASIRNVSGKAYCKATLYYSANSQRFSDQYFWPNAGRKVLYLSIHNVESAATNSNFKFLNLE